MKNDAKKLMEEYSNQVSSLMTQRERELQEEYTFHKNYDIYDVAFVGGHRNVSDCDCEGCACCLFLLCAFAANQ